MSLPLECRYFFDSARGGRASGSAASWDLAADPAAVAELAELGVARDEAPALLLSEPDGKPRVLGVRLTAEEASRLAAGEGLPAEGLTLYSSEWCPDCRRAKRVLEEAEVAFEEVNIDSDRGAEELVLARAGGRRVVPTLRFEERLWAFNPDPPLLRKLLAGGAAARRPRPTH
ncbi:MAG TPA: glutaredoxin domain-containing protein [Thermoanaerobaculia bacterium]|nr:glutaredoxin domain-containing protein [Thermoanaerobaculia bacterium]